jgi:hypothetical protein
MRYLRSKVDGFIYEWHPILAANPKLEEVSEQEAFPERFIPKDVAQKHADLKRDDRQLDLFTADIPVPPPVTNRALNAEASRVRKK